MCPLFGILKNVIQCPVPVSSRVTFQKWNELTFVCQYLVLWMGMDGHVPIAGLFVPLMFESFIPKCL